MFRHLRRRPAGIASRRVRCVALCLAAVGGLHIGTATAGPADDVTVGPTDRLPPRPAEVDLVDDAPEGEIGFTEAVVWLDLETGQAGQPELAIVNSGEGSITLQLEPTSVAIDGDGRPMPVVGGGDRADRDGEGALPDASDWVVLAEDEVYLDPGERARLWPTVVVPDGADERTHLTALRARAPEGDPPIEVVTFLAISVGPTELPVPELGVTFTQRGAVAVTVIELASPDTVDVISGDVRVRGWWGISETKAGLPATLVLPDLPRQLPLEVSTPWIPGRYTAEVTVVGRAGEEVVAADVAWLWRWEAAVGVAVVALAVAIVALLRLSLRRRDQPLDPTGADA